MSLQGQRALFGSLSPDSNGDGSITCDDFETVDNKTLFVKSLCGDPVKSTTDFVSGVLNSGEEAVSFERKFLSTAIGAWNSSTGSNFPAEIRIWEKNSQNSFSPEHYLTLSTELNGEFTGILRSGSSSAEEVIEDSGGDHSSAELVTSLQIP